MFYATISTIENPEEKVIYYPGDDKCCVYNANLTLKVGQCGTFDFIVPAINPYYADLIEWAIITIYRDGQEFWRGFISEISVDFLGNASVYCLEDLAWLNSEVYTVSAGTATRATLLNNLITSYNGQNGISGTVKEFEVGAIYYGSTTEIHYEFSYDDTMLSAIRQVAGDDFVRVRRSNGHRYIDILRLQDYQTENTQKIEFAYNLLDYTKELTTSEMITAIKPYGAELTSEVYEGLTARLEGTVIENSTSIAKYGRIIKNVIFDDVTDATTLQTKASEYLQKNSQPKLALELNALDMSELGTDTSKLEVGDEIQVIAEPYAINQRIRITELKIDLQDASKNTYTLSDEVQTGKTLTSQTIDSAKKVESMPEENDILKAAKRNAVNMLNGSDGGYLNFIFNSSGQMVGFQITNTIDPDDATKKWIWNDQGLGFMYKDSDGNWQTNNAMTADGAIVAERITAGTLTGQTINGATINTLTNGKVESTRTDGSKVTISGGSLIVKNTDDSFLQVEHTNGKLVTLGGSRWGCYNGSAWRWFEPMKLFEMVNKYEDGDFVTQ